MKRLFILAATILGLSGILHLARLFSSPIDTAAIIPVIVIALFGVGYLVIAYLLFRHRDSGVLAGVIVPLIGLMVTLLGMRPNPDWLTQAIIVLNILSIAVCGYILLAGRGTLKRVR
jgi:hypothetical protein